MWGSMWGLGFQGYAGSLAKDRKEWPSVADSGNVELVMGCQTERTRDFIWKAWEVGCVA